MSNYIILAIGIALALACGVLARRYAMIRFLWRRHKSHDETIVWLDRGPVPLAEMRYTPQGLTWVEGKLILANSWRDRRSRVYEIDPQSMELLRHFDMPAEAVHTSGLAWDGKRLWGVDYKSNRGYCLDLEASFRAQQAVVIGSFQTTLRGTSACCLLPWEGRTYLAISDFMRSTRTIFVRHDDALAAGTAAGAIDFWYRNEGFSQGLEFIDGFLYESENKRGRNAARGRSPDIVNKLDLAMLAEHRNAHLATVHQFTAPGHGVEDLAWDGEHLWTTDEISFRFFMSRVTDHNSPETAC